MTFVSLRRPLFTLYLPVPMDVAGAVLEFVARQYPNATLENVDGDTTTLAVMVTEYVDDDDPRLIHAPPDADLEQA